MRSAALTVGITLTVAAGASPAPEAVWVPAGAVQQVDSASINNDLGVALEPWTGDFDGMVERRIVRILVPYSRTFFFLDGATERGVVATAGRELEREINRQQGLSTRLVHVMFIPVRSSELIPMLLAGKGDIAAGGLTITEGRRDLVDFSEPTFRNVSEVVVTGPGAPAIGSIEDLSGKEVHVQASSAYFETLDRLNRTFENRGMAPIVVRPLDETLSVDEILELVHAGMVPITLSSSYLATFWAQLFPGITVHTGVVAASGREVGWAVRRNSPQLLAVLNGFIPSRRHRTEFGNILLRRYLQGLRWVENATASADQQRFDLTMPLFERFGAKYDLDPLLLAALGYQESRLDQRMRSSRGAIGVMQLLPATGSWMNVGDITLLEPNVHAGTRYVRTLVDAMDSPGIDDFNRMLMALAAYNGGQTRIRRLRRETAEQGLDPDVWFHNVELAVARGIGFETVQFVRNIYRYYLVFRLVEEKRAPRPEAPRPEIPRPIGSEARSR